MPIVIETRERVISITWDRPPLNVLDLALLHELADALTHCASAPADIVILRGAGQRAFSAGVDIRDHTVEKVPEMLEVVHGVIRKLVALPQVTIAAVRGVCLGGGCEVASSCDLVIATEESSFATPEISSRLLSSGCASALYEFDRLSPRRGNDSYRKKPRSTRGPIDRSH